MTTTDPAALQVTSDISARRPRARCTICRSPAVVRVCHHCHQPLCGRHTLTRHATWRRTLAAQWRLLVSGSTRRSLYDPGSVRWCPLCAGRRPDLDPELIAVPVTALLGAGAWISEVMPLAALVLSVAAVRSGLLVRRHWPRRRANPWATPRLSLFPRFVAVRAWEELSGRFVLDRRQRFTTSVEPPTGLITVTALFSASDRKELLRYRNRHHHGKQRRADVRFSAGTLVLAGAAGVEFTDLVSTRQVQRGRVVALEESTGHHPFLTGTDRQDRGAWATAFPYQIPTALNGTPVELPIWITPGIVPESDCRALDLEVQWRDFGAGTKQAVLERLELLIVDVPAHWGAVQRATSAPVTPPIDEDTGIRRLEFRGLRADPASRRLHLSIRFENRINLDSRITGRLTAIFSGTISGIRRVLPYDANGNPVRQTRPRRPYTRTEVDFVLELGGLRYQDVEVIAKKAIDTQAIPDHLTVARLTNTLSADDYYIKRVIENPPRGSRRLNTVNRYWDIAGRYYDGIFPIGFHIILTGDEEHDGGPRAVRGQASAQLVVQGTYANEDMRQKINAAWDELAGRIERALAVEDEAETVNDRIRDLQLRLDESLAVRNNAIMDLHRLRDEVGNDRESDVHALRRDIVRWIEDELLPRLRGEQ